MSILNLLSLSYWFATPPVISFAALLTLLIVFGLMFLTGITFKKLSHDVRIEKFTAKIMARWGTLLTVMALLGYLYVFLRYERTPLFSLRIFLGLWLIGAFFWAYRVYLYQTTKIPELRARHDRDAQKYAYLR
jgi:small-conductance mechanosensitive channel